jgi:hypothetical protein
MPVFAKDPIERVNRKAFSFHVGKLDRFSGACLEVEIDVKFRVWNYYTKRSLGLEKPVEIAHNVGGYCFVEMLKAMFAVDALQTVVGKRYTFSYVPAEIDPGHP